VPAGLPRHTLQRKERPSPGQNFQQILLHLAAYNAGSSVSGESTPLEQWRNVRAVLMTIALNVRAPWRKRGLYKSSQLALRLHVR